MSSKFLSGGQFDDLTNGTFELNVATATVQNLAPGLPVRTAGTRKLTTGLIQLNDCNFTPLTDPATADLNMGGHSILNATSVLGTGAALGNLGSSASSFDAAYLQGGGIASWLAYKQTTPISIVAADGEKSCTNVADQKNNWGTLTWTAPFFRGQIMKLDAFFTVASDPGDTYTFKLKVDGADAARAVGNFNFGVAQGASLAFDMFVAPGAPDTLAVFTTQLVSGEPSEVTPTSINFNRSASHTVELTCQWSGVSLTDAIRVLALRASTYGATHVL